MDGANIFSNLVQDPTINNVVGAVLNNSSSTTTTITTTNSNGTESTITVQRFDYSAPDPIGASQSIPFAGKPRDTAVGKRSEQVVDILNTRDSVRAAKVSERKNIEHNKKRN